MTCFKKYSKVLIQSISKNLINLFLKRIKAMSKKIIIGVVVFLFLATAGTNSAVADLYMDLYMTDSFGSTTSQTVFDWDDTPWLYLQFPEGGWNATVSWWEDTDSNYYFTGSTPSTEQDIWLSINNWDSIKRIGLWEVNAVFFHANRSRPTFGFDSTSFTVNPEPISSILFVSGGATLAFRHYRKKKKKV